MTALDDAERAERLALLRELRDAQCQMQSAILPHVSAQLQTFPLTIQQLRVLTILGTSTDGNTVACLAGIVEVSLATMSGLIDRLNARGMVTRIDDAHDQRVRRVVATEEGRKLLERLVATQPHLEPWLIDALEISDLRALAQGVAALTRALSEHQPKPALEL